MVIQHFCEDCDKWIEVPGLSSGDKLALMNVLRNDGLLHAVKFVKENGYFELKEAKEFVEHLRLNNDCKKCGHAGLFKEIEFCPECSSLNIALK